MICKQCLIDRIEKDFYNSDVCYKCIYKKKMQSIQKISRKMKLCRICKIQVPLGKDVYCSEKCAYEGKLKKDKEYWFHKCVAQKISWKN